MPLQEPGRDDVPLGRRRREWLRDLTEEGIEPQPGPSRRAGWRQKVLTKAVLDLGIIFLLAFAWVGDYLAGLAVQLLPSPPRAVDSEAEEEAELLAAQRDDFERQ